MQASAMALVKNLRLAGGAYPARPAAFLATARKSAAYSRVMDTKGDKMLTRDFTPQSHISQTLKDAELILAEARRRFMPVERCTKFQSVAGHGVSADVVGRRIAIDCARFG